jgi:hypothetical protein
MNPLSFFQSKILSQTTSVLSFLGKHPARLPATAGYTLPPGRYRNFGDAIVAKTESMCLGRDHL